MSIEHLQELIRSCKTPIALQLNPDLERVSPKIRKNFTDLYGDCPMSRAETLRYHGSQLISLAAGKLPAVLLRADCYLRCGFMGMDVLSNLVNMAKNQGMYTIIDARTVYPDVWVGGEVNADGVTVMPYIGSDCCAVSEGKAAFAAVRTANPSAARCRTSWPVTASSMPPPPGRWRATARLCSWRRATRSISRSCAAARRRASSCSRAATVRMPSPPSTTMATAPSSRTATSSTPKSPLKPSTRPSAG